MSWMRKCPLAHQYGLSALILCITLAELGEVKS